MENCCNRQVSEHIVLRPNCESFHFICSVASLPECVIDTTRTLAVRNGVKEILTAIVKEVYMDSLIAFGSSVIFTEPGVRQVLFHYSGINVDEIPGIVLYNLGEYVGQVSR